MEPLKKEKTKSKSGQRVLLQNNQIKKIDTWISQVEATHKSIKLNRSEVLQWIVEQKKDVLTQKELGSIYNKFFDEEAHLQWALKKFKENKKAGTPLILSKLLKSPYSKQNSKGTVNSSRKSKASSKARAVQVPGDA